MWIPLLLVVATAAAYQDVRRHEFIDLDDQRYIVQNRDLRVASLGEALEAAFLGTSQVNWTPLTVLSLQADTALHGGSAAGYLSVNLALHAASAVLLFFAMLRLSGQLAPSAFVAAVFALHPLHVESVAWAAQRKDVLSGLFWMLTLLSYATYVQRPGAARYAGLVLALCAALLSKPVAVTLPCVLLLLDLWPLGRLATAADRRRALLEKLPLLLPVAAVAGLTLWVQVDAMPSSAQLPLAMRVANTLDAYVVYVWKSLWPTGLAVFYPYASDGIPAWRLVTAGLLLVVTSAGAFALARRRPYLLVGWLWYLVTLVPMVGLVQVGVQARADRYTYIPQIGLAIALAWAARDLAGDSRRRQRWMLGLGSAACLALALATSAQVRHWRSAVALHTHSVSVTRDNLRELLRLSMALRDAGRHQQAIAPLEQALEIAPAIASEQITLGDLYAREARLEEAEQAYRRGLQLDPRHAPGQLNLGLTLVRLHRPEPALTHLNEAIRIHSEQTGSAPRIPRLYLALARAHVELGELDEALRAYRTAVSESRPAPRVAAALGIALAEAGRLDEASAVVRPALSVEPGSRELLDAAQRIEAGRQAALR